MFQRFHEKKDERGFTLIELLVVILIIAILAAIAIPVFLRQREKGWISQVESALKNAATAQESYLVETGTYTADVTQLEGATNQGLQYAADVNFASAFVIDAGRSYCMTATHNNLGTRSWKFDSGFGAPQEVAGSVVACS